MLSFLRIRWPAHGRAKRQAPPWQELFDFYVNVNLDLPGRALHNAGALHLFACALAQTNVMENL
jgi:alpha-beta hydrolase superfamily lysophospholipase